MLPCSVPTLPIAAIILILSCFPLHLPVHAQPFRPSGAYGTYNNFIENEAFFIGGGLTNAVSAARLDQAFTIDLSVSWNTTDPKFDRLSQGPAQDTVPSGISADGNQWLVCYSSATSSGCFAYSMDKKKWDSVFEMPGVTIMKSSGAVDPATGILYIPNAVWANMLVVQPTNTFNKRPMPDALLPTQQAAVGWSEHLKKLLLFGGTTGAIGQTDFFHAFSFSEADGWVNLTSSMKGQVPTPRAGACLVPAYGGSKMILYGGATIENTVIYSDVFVLDVATMNWTKGPQHPTKQGLTNTACAYSNDFLITWGGQLKNSVATSATYLFSLKTNNWETTYIPGQAKPRPKSSGTTEEGHSKDSPDQSSSSSSSSPRVTDIVAGVLGAVAVVLIIWFLLLRRRRIGQKQSESSPTKPRDPETTHDPGCELQKSQGDSNIAPRNPHQSISQSPQQYPPEYSSPTFTTSANHSTYSLSTSQPEYPPRSWIPTSSPRYVYTGDGPLHPHEPISTQNACVGSDSYRSTDTFVQDGESYAYTSNYKTE
ncbi:hypothetical protein B0O80DRAFT_492938 [Mortierella sp. GBAus27b]|nr:hypothetical protein B0O80DRAFT_492938 [Mortierella sp. GBAus27b]